MIPKRILLCTDFSENSTPARAVAVAYAKVFNAELWVLHVINSSQIGYPAIAEGLPLDIRVVLDAIEENVKRALELVVSQCRSELPEVQAFSVTGLPSFEIAQFAAENEVDLIVMGTHGWTGFKHLIMGSTAENVLRSARCPVLTVKSEANSV